MADRTFSPKAHPCTHIPISLKSIGLPCSPRAGISIQTASIDFSPSVPGFPPFLPYLFPSASDTPIPWWFSPAALKFGADGCLSKPTDCQSLSGRRVSRGRAPFRIRRRRRLGLQEKIRVRKSTSKAFWFGWNRDCCWCSFGKMWLGMPVRSKPEGFFGSTMAGFVFGRGIEESWGISKRLRGLKMFGKMTRGWRWRYISLLYQRKDIGREEELWLKKWKSCFEEQKQQWRAFGKFIYMHCLSRYSMPFHLFIYGVVLPWWYQGCHWLQLNWMMQRNKKEAETDDQKRSITSTSLSVWMSECVCVRVCCIHCLVDWPLETSFVPHSDKLWNHQDTTAVQDLSGPRRESGALQSFDRISQKQVGVEPFATVFWKTKRDGVCTSGWCRRLHASWSTNTHWGQISFYPTGQTCLIPILFTTGWRMDRETRIWIRHSLTNLKIERHGERNQPIYEKRPGCNQDIQKKKKAKLCPRCVIIFSHW